MAQYEQLEVYLESAEWLARWRLFLRTLEERKFCMNDTDTVTTNDTMTTINVNSVTDVVRSHGVMVSFVVKQTPYL